MVDAPMRLWLSIITLVAVAPVSDAFAQQSESVSAVRIVVPTPRGRKAYGGSKLVRALRASLRDDVGAVISARRMRAAQKRLGLAGRAKWNRRGLAKAGREIGADYVLYIRVTRKGWLYTAQARLINTATNEIQMDFRSQYYDPRKEAADRGERIARRTVLKMQTLAEEGQLLATGKPRAAPPPRSIESMTSIPPRQAPTEPALAPESPADADPALKNPWNNEGTNNAAPLAAAPSPPASTVEPPAVAAVV
ncbi:MAG: hypothetical protein AAFN74_27215, partial [Myxococcota bacterium]